MAKSSNLEYTKLVLLCLGLLAIVMTEAKRDLHHGTKKHEMTVDTVVEKTDTTAGLRVVVKTHTTAGWSFGKIATTPGRSFEKTTTPGFSVELAEELDCCALCTNPSAESCSCVVVDENGVPTGEEGHCYG